VDTQSILAEGRKLPEHAVHTLLGEFNAEENTMNRYNILSVWLMVLAAVLPVRQAAAQSANNIVGTWALVSVEGPGFIPFGSAPKGLLIFTANGRFSSFFMRTDLPQYASDKRVEGTAAEYKATVEGSLAYFGTYSVNGTDLNLHIEGSTFPNWIGADQKRTNIAVTADEFKYTQPLPSGGGPPAVIALKRVK
jgi:hypothetical protein